MSSDQARHLRVSIKIAGDGEDDALSLQLCRKVKRATDLEVFTENSGRRMLNGDGIGQRSQFVAQFQQVGLVPFLTFASRDVLDDDGHGSSAPRTNAGQMQAVPAIVGCR